ncbi:MAG: hypothetical protein MPJ78_16020 [Hyphomicrobiaceae bacterium]|nr:hypothetical protein [Hyphomicrobiaceae bacterium]
MKREGIARTYRRGVISHPSFLGWEESFASRVDNAVLAPHVNSTSSFDFGDADQQVAVSIQRTGYSTMPVNGSPNPAQYALVLICLAAMFAVALSPLQGLFWDGVVLLLLAVSMTALGQNLLQTLTVFTVVLVVGFVFLPAFLS